MNTGTLPIKLSEVIHNKVGVQDTSTGVDYGRDQSMFDYIGAEYYFDVYNASDVRTGSSAVINTSSSTQWVEVFVISSDIPEIEPGGYVELHTRVYFDSAADNDLENKAFEFSVTPKFAQYN